MNNVFVYCEIEGTTVADVSLELLTKGRKLANQLGCQLEAIAAGTGLAGIEKQVLPYGVDKLHVFDAPGLFPYTSLPHTSILVNLFKEEKPQICLMGATVIGSASGTHGQDSYRRTGMCVFQSECLFQGVQVFRIEDGRKCRTVDSTVSVHGIFPHIACVGNLFCQYYNF